MSGPKTPIIEKPTINDVARVAGVSLATVDRVLNGRSGVRAATIEKVNNAIAELGYVRDTAAANLARRRVYNLAFLLPDSNNEFVAALEEKILEQAERSILDRTLVSIHKAPAFDAEAIVTFLDALDPSETDGVAVFGPETPSVRDAVTRARDRGIVVVALVSDLPSSSRDHFVGIDNVAAGATAAQLMGRFVHRTGGEILFITGSRLARDHLERRVGFDQVMAAQFPHLDVLPSLEGRDDPQLLAELLPGVFAAHPEICGVYSSGGGNGGLIRFLAESGRRGSRDLTIIAHELTPLTRSALEDGVFDAIISQDAGHLARSALRLMRATADDAPFDATQEQIRIDIYLKENAPPGWSDAPR